MLRAGVMPSNMKQKKCRTYVALPAYRKASTDDIVARNPFIPITEGRLRYV